MPIHGKTQQFILKKVNEFMNESSVAKNISRKTSTLNPSSHCSPLRTSFTYWILINN